MEEILNSFIFKTNFLFLLANSLKLMIKKENSQQKSFLHIKISSERVLNYTFSVVIHTAPTVVKYTLNIFVSNYLLR
jgi:hypothetical protein